MAEENRDSGLIQHSEVSLWTYLWGVRTKQTTNLTNPSSHGARSVGNVHLGDTPSVYQETYTPVESLKGKFWRNCGLPAAGFLIIVSCATGCAAEVINTLMKNP